LREDNRLLRGEGGYDQKSAKIIEIKEMMNETGQIIIKQVEVPLPTGTAENLR
jgi:hypothetical protein